MSTPTAAPLPVDDVEAALRPLGEATVLPVAAYTAPEVLAWEREHLYDGGWVCAGRAVDVAGAGAQRAVAAGRGSVLLVRDDDGELRAFANVCRHRGHELLPVGGAACRGAIRCPYHGWTYGLDGGLRRAAGGGVDPVPRAGEAIGLAPVAVTEWHGWVLVNASGTAAPLPETVDGLDEVLAPYAPERLVTVASHDYEVAANWKVVHENYQECLHCPQIHPQLCVVSPADSSANVAPGPAWVGGWMDVAEGAETLSTSGRLIADPLPGLDAAARRRVAYFAVLPNLLVSAHPDYVLTHRLEPLAPDRTRVECEWLVADAATDAGDAVEFWDLTNRQDWAACESVQRGLASGAYRPGPLTAREDAVHAFIGLIARAYMFGHESGL